MRDDGREGRKPEGRFLTNEPVRPVVVMEGATVRSAILAAVEAAIAPLLARVEALERRQEPRLSASDYDRLQVLLPALGNVFGPAQFSAREAFEHPGVKPLVAGRSVRSIGMLLTSAAGQNVGGLTVRVSATAERTNAYEILRVVG